MPNIAQPQGPGETKYEPKPTSHLSVYVAVSPLISQSSYGFLCVVVARDCKGSHWGHSQNTLFVGHVGEQERNTVQLWAFLNTQWPVMLTGNFAPSEVYVTFFYTSPGCDPQHEGMFFFMFFVHLKCKYIWVDFSFFSHCSLPLCKHNTGAV